MPKKKGIHSKTGQRRLEIIQAALSCFDEYGFNETTIEDIRKRSNASSGSIYHHFKSKDQLGAAVYLEGIKHYQQGVLEHMEKNNTPKGLIESMVGFYFQWMKDNTAWARYLMQMRQEAFMELSANSIVFENKQYIERLAALFTPKIKAGKLRKLPLEIYISLILGPCECYGRFWLDKVTDADIRLATREIIESAWNSLKM